MSAASGASEPHSPSPDAAIPRDLLEILVCPLGRAPLRLEGEALVCTRCGLVFAIDEGIPRMLVEDARLPEGVERIEDLACYPREKGEGETV